MADEGKDPVVEEIQPDQEGKYPETIPWDKYVGIKEAWGRSKEKVASLEEKIKTTVTPEEHEKVKTELAETKVAHEKTSTELNESKEQTLTEKRSILTKRGIPEDKVKDMSVKELDAAFVVLEHSTPKPDLGGGGGSGAALVGTPQELARRAYAKD